MYLRFARRRKDGKEHRYWSIVESRRCAGGRVVQRPVLYLGEINDSQHATWCRLIEAFDEGSARYRQLALFPSERSVPDQAQGFGVQVRLEAMELHRPRQWGADRAACDHPCSPLKSPLEKEDKLVHVVAERGMAKIEPVPPSSGCLPNGDCQFPFGPTTACHSPAPILTTVGVASSHDFACRRQYWRPRERAGTRRVAQDGATCGWTCGGTGALR
jgi:hypothetical protein